MVASLATTAPTQFLDAGGTRFAYRRFGTSAGTPLIFTQHFMGNRRRPRLHLPHHGAHPRPGQPRQRRDRRRIPGRRPGVGLSTRGQLRLPRRDRPARPRRQRQQRHRHTDNQLLPPLPAPPRRRADPAPRLRPRRPLPVRQPLRPPGHRLPRPPTARHRYPHVTALAGRGGLLSETGPIGPCLDHIRAGGETVPGRHRGRGPARSGSPAREDDGADRPERLLGDHLARMINRLVEPTTGVRRAGRRGPRSAAL